MHKYADSFGFILHAELEICFIGEGFQWNEKFVTILLSNSLIIESRKNISNHLPTKTKTLEEEL